jgi:hypothetical protein
MVHAGLNHEDCVAQGGSVRAQDRSQSPSARSGRPVGLDFSTISDSSLPEVSVDASLVSNPTASCSQCPIRLREIASLKQAYHDFQSDSESRNASLQASCAAITASLEQFKRKHLADTDELIRRLCDLGQVSSQLNAQGLREANELRDLSAHLSEQLRESERRYRESASKQLSDFEGARDKRSSSSNSLSALRWRPAEGMLPLSRI